MQESFSKTVRSIGEAYKEMYSPQEELSEAKKEEAVDLDTKNADKALRHDCASHVQHEEYGLGVCIPGQHTIKETTAGEGVVTHYDVMFEDEEGPFIMEDVPVKDLKIKKESSHMHKRKK